MIIHKRTVTLIQFEDGSGWMWSETGRTYKKLSKAVSMVNRDAALMAESVGAVATIIEYVPASSAGTAEVKKITG